MNLRLRSNEAPEINLTSLIDVVLLLLVFFMVSTSFVREAEINLRLPEANAESRPATVAEVLEITVSRTGSYTVNGRALVNNERRTLRAAIEALTGEDRDMPLFIRGRCAGGAPGGRYGIGRGRTDRLRGDPYRHGNFTRRLTRCFRGSIPA